MKMIGNILAAATLMTVAGAAHASPFTTVNIDPYVNANVLTNSATLPTGLTTGNKGTSIPFLMSSRINNMSSVWLAPAQAGAKLVVDLTPFAMTGQSSFYALLNNYYGTPGADEYDITIASANHSVTYQSIGGRDTRDYNFNPATTGTIGANTTAWFDNGQGQRYDVRTFSLPNYFGSEALTSFTITQVQAKDQAIFGGLTFSNLPAGAVPEPASWAMMIVGIGAVGFAMRRRAKVATTVSYAG